MTLPLRTYLEQITGKLKQEDWELLSGILEPKVLDKGEILLSESEYCRHIWYLKEGAVRLFENRDGDLRTTHFFIAPSMFTDYHSLITGQPTELSFRAEETCELEALPYDKLLKLYDRSHQLERIGRIMAEYQFIAEFNRRRMLLHMDALERYEHLEANQPEVFQRFQLKDIASFLGITPVSLSRLRKYRAKK